MGEKQHTNKSPLRCEPVAIRVAANHEPRFETSALPLPNFVDMKKLEKAGTVDLRTRRPCTVRLHRGQNPQNREKRVSVSKNSHFPMPQKRAP